VLKMYNLAMEPAYAEATCPRLSQVNCVKSSSAFSSNNNTLVWAFNLQTFPQQRDQSSSIVFHSLGGPQRVLRRNVQTKNPRNLFQVFLHLLFHFSLRCRPHNVPLRPRPKQSGLIHRNQHPYKQHGNSPPLMYLWTPMESPTSSISRTSFQTGTKTLGSSSKMVSWYALVLTTRRIT
jgi:hypothetical protein